MSTTDVDALSTDVVDKVIYSVMTHPSFCLPSRRTACTAASVLNALGCVCTALSTGCVGILKQRRCKADPMEQGSARL